METSFDSILISLSLSPSLCSSLCLSVWLQFSTRKDSHYEIIGRESVVTTLRFAKPLHFKNNRFKLSKFKYATQSHLIIYVGQTQYQHDRIGCTYTTWVVFNNLIMFFQLLTILREKILAKLLNFS